MMRCCSVIGALGLAACTGQGLPAAVVVATMPASAAECAFGGVVVSSGADANGNGVLDEDEVASRTAVCGDRPATPPPTTVVRLLAEPAGAHCMLDGTAVQSGPDRNGNGVLDDDEVTHIDYACGEPLLTRLAPAPPDVSCIAGGIAFLAGRDRNHDGRLADDEVEQREVACGDVIARDIAVRDAADAAAMAGIAVITGSLVVDATALGELALPRLVQVRGGIDVKRNTALVRVSLPALDSVDGRFVLALDPALTEIDVPLLRRVGGLVVDRNTALRGLGRLAALPEVAGDVQIASNDALASVDLAIGRIGGGLAIDGNAQLTRVTASLAGGLGAVHIASNPQLASIELAGTAAGRLTEVGGVTVQSNRALDRVSLDADDLGAILIGDSPRLAEVAVTGTQVGGDVSLLGNGGLRLAVSALAPDTFTIGGSLIVMGPAVAITSSRPLVVNAHCTIERTHLAAFGPDVVSRVGGRLALRDNPRLTAISTIALGQGFEVSGNHALTNLDFQIGDVFRGGLTIADNATLEAATFDGLRQVEGTVTIEDNPALKAFAPSLEEVTGELLIERNDSVTDLGLTRLRRVGGLSIVRCGSLTEIELPALTLVGFFFFNIVGNPELRHIRFPVLRQAKMNVVGNPRLPTCEVLALFALVDGEHNQRSNDDSAECEP